MLKAAQRKNCDPLLSRRSRRNMKVCSPTAHHFKCSRRGLGHVHGTTNTRSAEPSLFLKRRVPALKAADGVHAGSWSP